MIPHTSASVGTAPALSQDAQGVPRGESPRRFFGGFLIGEKATLRSKPKLPVWQFPSNLGQSPITVATAFPTLDNTTRWGILFSWFRPYLWCTTNNRYWSI